MTHTYNGHPLGNHDPSQRGLRLASHKSAPRKDCALIVLTLALAFLPLLITAVTR